MKESIYPHQVRTNYLASSYCELAMDHYYQALVAYDNMEKAKFHDCVIGSCIRMEKHVIATVIFAQMCLESFFNDYAAACLGDSEFYDNFDKLDLKRKFLRIAKVILRAEVDKSKSYFSHLFSLIRNRNMFVHNKSHRAEFQGYSAEEFKDIYENREFGDSYMNKAEIADAKASMRDGLNALKAIRDIAYYFDEHDANAFALVKLMSPWGLFDSEEERKQRELIFSKLKIKTEPAFTNGQKSL